MFSGKVMNRVTVFELVGIQRHQLQIGTFPAIMSPALKNFGHQHVGVGTLKIPGHDRRYRQFPPGRIGPRQLWRNRSCADCQTGLQPLPTGVAETLHQFHGSISHRLFLLGIWSLCLAWALGLQTTPDIPHSGTASNRRPELPGPLYWILFGKDLSGCHLDFWDAKNYSLASLALSAETPTLKLLKGEYKTDFLHQHD